MSGGRGTVGFRVFTRIERPAESLIRAYERIEATNLADAMHGMGAMDSGIRPLVPLKGPVVGPAVTCSITPGNGLLIRKAIEVAQPGDVLVVNGFGNLQRAVVGGNVLMSMVAKGLRALVLDGAIRDVEEAQQIGLPIFARGVVARAGTNNLGKGEVNVPVACGGIAVLPGDLVVADADGVVVVPGPDVAGLIEHASQVQLEKGWTGDYEARWEAARRAGGKAGAKVDAALAREGCTIVE